MGLDMYMRAKKYLWSFDQETSAISTQIGEILGLPVGIRTNEIAAEVGYWRKANHIHKWFVDNVQDGQDECQEHYVDNDNLKDLLETCEKVMADKTLAPELLPTQQGFFFGGEDYDEYYFDDVQRTIDFIKGLEKLPDRDSWSIHYQSSW